jgi:hypothetical protein
MKTTITIDQDLFVRAQKIARRDGTTLHTLIQEGLSVVLALREQKSSYRWPDLSVGGEGLTPGVEEGAWDE